MANEARRGIRTMARVALVVGCLVVACAYAADPAKVLRLASNDIDTFDPHQYNDSPSYEVQRAIFESLYEWDYLASPTRLSPVLAAGPPEISADGLTWIVRMQPGIRFTPDPAFGGKPREVTAADVVYSTKRMLDPNLRRGGAPLTTDLLVGMRAVVDAARASGKLDFDTPVEGLRALDRYTLQIKLTDIDYPLIEGMLTFNVAAREVIEAAGADLRTRPVGTGPYRLKEWKRGSRIVLEANPDYRAIRFPASGDPARAALERTMAGKTLPQVGFVDIAVIEEDATRILEFERGNLDAIIVRSSVVNRLLANGQLKPEFAARGIVRQVAAEPYTFSFLFNMKDPVLGGYGREGIALRRAIALGTDIDALIDVVYAGQALPANQMLPPNVRGHDPSLPGKSRYDPGAAKALLDRAGYDQRDAAGYRLAPGGKPLTLTFSLRAAGISREVQTLVHRNMETLGLRMEFRVSPFQDLIKELEAGKFQLYFGGYGGQPVGNGILLQLYSRAPAAQNSSRFALPEYDAQMKRFLRAATASEQVAAARRMSEIAENYVPLLPIVFRLENNFTQPWVQGYLPPLFDTYWKYLDIDLAQRKQARGK